MLKIVNKSYCCGCTACESICGVGALSMVPDKLGFVYPTIDVDKCIDCGLCQRVCSFKSLIPSLDKRFPLFYAARHRNVNEVERSRSGAVFVALSDWILNNGGSVYGAALTDTFEVFHKRVTTFAERDSLRGSKYVQSDISGIYKQVKYDLINGMKVLFSGTPCQVSGLKSYLSILKVDLSNLLLVDVVCHGVPSPFYWRDYISYIERKEGTRITSVNFRDKERFGWSSHKESFRFANGESKSFRHSFYHDIMLRRSCGVCPYSSTQRVSDITIGDFWGWERLGCPINDDNKGVNLLMVNTEQGEYIFDEIKGRLIYYQTEESKCLQPNLLHPTSPHPLQQSFEEDYIYRGFEYVGKRYTDLGWRREWNNVKSIVKGMFQKVIK